MARDFNNKDTKSLACTTAEILLDVLQNDIVYQTPPCCKELKFFDEGHLIDFPNVNLLIVGFDYKDSNKPLLCISTATGDTDSVPFCYKERIEEIKYWFADHGNLIEYYDFLEKQFKNCSLFFISPHQFIADKFDRLLSLEEVLLKLQTNA